MVRARGGSIRRDDGGRPCKSPSLIGNACPPILFSEPGRTKADVTPPASVVRNEVSCSFNPSTLRTMGRTGLNFELISECVGRSGIPCTPRCVCMSITPGVSHRPHASTSIASDGASTCAIVDSSETIRPWLTNTSFSTKMVSPSNTVALRITVARVPRAKRSF